MPTGTVRASLRLNTSTHWCKTFNVRIKEAILLIVSFSIGTLLGRRFIRERPFKVSSPPPTNTLPAPTHQPKLTREDVIHLIEAHGGPEGLDLSGYDLSGANLRNLNLHGTTFSTYHFGSRFYQSANLSGSNFTDANLTRANLIKTNLQNASFWQATLVEATLAYAYAHGAHFGEADLTRADCYGCQLEGASLWKANLVSANLFLARITNTEMTNARLGSTLLQESETAYKEYFDRWYTSSVPDGPKGNHLSKRHAETADIYMNLKNAYLSNGHYREASWAYLKERRMRRATLAPWRARTYYGEAAVGRKSGFLGWRLGWFYLKYTGLWLFDWLNDATSGYGERPLRTLWLAVVVLLFFPLLYWWSGQLSLENGVTLKWLDYFIFSLGAFTTMDFGRFVTDGWLAEILASLEALLGISILALLMFALGNRISRS